MPLYLPNSLAVAAGMISRLARLSFGSLRRVTIPALISFASLRRMVPREQLEKTPGKASQQRVWFRHRDPLPDDPVLHICALAYMSDARYSLSEIAYLLGFSGGNNFARAFRRWTGKAPSEHRR